MNKGKHWVAGVGLPREDVFSLTLYPECATYLHSAICEEHMASLAIQYPYFVCDRRWRCWIWVGKGIWMRHGCVCP